MTSAEAETFPPKVRFGAFSFHRQPRASGRQSPGCPGSGSVGAEVSVLKLPKDVVADPRHDAVLKLLTTHAGLLWESGRNQVATLPITDVLVAELRGALLAGHACQGLELIAD